MGVAEDVTGQELRMYPNQALWIYGTAHVIDISLPGRFESPIIASAERIKDPSQPVLCFNQPLNIVYIDSGSSPYREIS
jgi:hypothetical protein